MKIIFLLVVIVASFGWTIYILKPVLFPPPRKPNILVVSLCSLRYQALATYGYTDPELTPNINAFARRSQFIFDNAFNGLPWVGAFAAARAVIPENLFEMRGYRLLGDGEQGHVIRIPESLSWRQRQQRKALPGGTESEHELETDPMSSFDQNALEKNHSARLKHLRQILNTSRTEPFYLIAHLKYLHFPLIDRHNADSAWDKYLTPEERRKVTEYLDSPARFVDKLPFLLLLSHDPRVLAAIGKIERRSQGADPKRLSGLLTSPIFLARWKESRGYEDDLHILKKIYHANLHYLDQTLGEILNLYGNKDLQENTIVIFAGDHGELHMERDQVTHATTIYDEALKVPLMIRFPQSDQPQPQLRISDQVDFFDLAGLLEGVIEGQVSAENLPQFLARKKRDVFLVRDCPNTWRGLRYRNKYKYMVEIGSGKRFLYDLQSDPGETENLVDKDEKTAADMERLYWDNYEEFSDQYTYSCAPWAQ
ncbi:MAG: sulfatase [Bdellovibrionales bacterium]